jgi:hypothetical protein
MDVMTENSCRIVVVTFAIAIVLTAATSARAQHGDYPLGTSGGIAAAQQPPSGIYYTNLWSYYRASGSDFVAIGPLKCGPLDRVCLSLNVGGNGSLDLFIDQNIFWVVTPLTILGAHYGFLLDVPFAIADVSGAASIEPVLSRPLNSSLTKSFQTTGNGTKGSIGDIYLEPVDLGWHFPRLDVIASSAVVMPSGPYNANAKLNIGYGHWTGMFGLGGVAYADRERTWSLSIYAHCELYGSQMGRNYTLGYAVPFEWALGKSFTLTNDIVKQLAIGAVGYAQWQISGNSIDLTPTTKVATDAINTLESTRAQIYSAGPAIQALTKYGLFALRYYDEFGAHATPSGQQLMFSYTLGGNPLGWR